MMGWNNRLRTVLAALLAATVAWRAPAQAPDPPWRHADAPVRAVFELPPGRPFPLIELPLALVSNGTIARLAAYHGASNRQVRVAATNAATLTLLVHGDGLPPRSVIALYAITNGAPVAPDAAFADLWPVSVSIQRAGANEAPPTWADMRFMATRPDRARKQFLLEGLIPITSADEGPRQWYQGSWKRPVYVAHLSGWMLMPAAGPYRFAAKGHRPVYWQIGDTQVLETGTRSRRKRDWAESKPITLPAGPVHYSLFTLCDRELQLEVGWVPPGSSNIVALPQSVLLTGGAPVAARIERFGATLHAGADYAVDPGYAFHGHDARFTPVTLRSIHAAWEGAPSVTCRWTQAGITLGETPVWRFIATNAGALPIDLEVGNARGQRASARVNVAIPESPALAYRLATRLHGVPAIAYDDDPVQPEIHLRGTTPDDLPLTLTAWITPLDGQPTVRSETLALKQGWARLILPGGTVHDIASIRWEVTHAHVVVNAGRVRFARQPFDELPNRLDGDLPVMGDEPCVLVPRRASSGHPPPFQGLHAGRRLAVLDGFLAPPGRSGESNGSVFDRQLLGDIQIFGARVPGLAANGIRYRRQRFEDLAARLETRALDRLAPLTRLALLQPADIVVIVPDWTGPAGGETLDDFERRLAALAGLIRDALPAEVVLMTPPPGLLPGAQPEAAAPGRDPTRLYAETVQRVADALGITVADFYTMGYTRQATESVIDGILTDAGRQLAAETLARTLVGGRP